MQVEQLSEIKKKHLKAIKKQDQDIRAKEAVGIWKRRTWRRGLGRKGSGAVTPVTAPVTRAGSENEEEEDEDEDEEEKEEDSADENGEEKMIPIRRRSEGVTVDVPHLQIPKLARCRGLTISHITAPLPTASSTYALKPTNPPSLDWCYAEEIERTGYEAQEHGA